MAIDILAEPAVVTLSLYSTFNQFPSAPRDSTLDTFFDCETNEDFPTIVVTMEGEWFNKVMWADPVEITMTVDGDWPKSITISVDAAIITVGVQESDVLTEASKSNWLKWSDIGSLDFTIGQDNVAGERPLDWKGGIYDIKKLGNKVIVYGENGVSILTPSDKCYGLNTIYRIGLCGFGAVVGTDEVHYFIDNLGQLWKLARELELLDYSEYLAPMNDLVMSYDLKSELIYICNGTIGYVYSPKFKSMAEGPANITGVGTQSEVLYIAADGDVEIQPFEICTDIYDFGTRNFKTIRSIEIGTDLTTNLQASVDYRVSNRTPFSNIGWHLVTLEGISHIACFGLEFRFRLRVENYEYFEIDYFKINGLIHNYSYTEHSLRSINERRRVMYDS